jgi:hypothetical protein
MFTFLGVQFAQIPNWVSMLEVFTAVYIRCRIFVLHRVYKKTLKKEAVSHPKGRSVFILTRRDTQKTAKKLITSPYPYTTPPARRHTSVDPD